MAFAGKAGQPMSNHFKQTGGTLPAVYNAANEVAVDAFRAGKIPFPGIWQCVASVMQDHEVQASSSLESVVTADQWARHAAKKFCEALQ
jgi:1-deoxy-D-xylulose-5-phosphate reductoisomerase